MFNFFKTTKTFNLSETTINFKRQIIYFKLLKQIKYVYVIYIFKNSTINVNCSKTKLTFAVTLE